MAEHLSDDSSAASSSDEMFKMVIPFSQGSTIAATATPEGSNGKSLDSDDAEDGGGKQGHTKNNGKKRGHEEIAIEINVDATGTMEEKARANAKKAFNMTFHGLKIGAPDKLYWQKRSRKRKKLLFPVRVVPKEEVVGIALHPGWNEETHYPINNIQYPHSVIREGEGQYDVASKKSLLPYYGKEDGRKDRWCADNLKKYLKQLSRSRKGLEEVDLKNEEAFLQCVLENSLEQGEHEKHLSQVDEAVPEEISTSGNNDQALETNSENEDIEEGTRRTRRVSTGMHKKTEALKPGDIIEYYPQNCVAGNPKDLCRAKVITVNPQGERILTIDDPFTNLGPDHMVKRIQRKQGKHLLVNGGAKFRPINKYFLKKAGDPEALKNLLSRTAAQAKEIIQRNKEKTFAKMEEDGTSAFKGMIRK